APVRERSTGSRSWSPRLRSRSRSALRRRWRPPAARTSSAPTSNAEGCDRRRPRPVSHREPEGVEELGRPRLPQAVPAPLGALVRARLLHALRRGPRRHLLARLDRAHPLMDAVERQVEAYNARDVEAFVDCYAEEIVLEDTEGEVQM